MSIKADGSPVTTTDGVVEAAMRDELRRRRPADGFVGEESGTDVRHTRRWLVDPIDGTAAFAAGQTDWRTLIALEVAGNITIGLVSAPMIRRRWWATTGGGAWWRDATATEPGRLAVSSTRTLSDARVGIWPPPDDLPTPWRIGAHGLNAATTTPDPSAAIRLGTKHGALLVAAGMIDAFVLAGAGPWDLAAMVPIVEEAGGRFSDDSGGRSLRTPIAIFSNGEMHEQVRSYVGPAGS